METYFDLVMEFELERKKVPRCFYASKNDIVTQNFIFGIGEFNRINGSKKSILQNFKKRELIK